MEFYADVQPQRAVSHLPLWSTIDAQRGYDSYLIGTLDFNNSFLKAGGEILSHKLEECWPSIHLFVTSGLEDVRAT